MRSKLLNTIFQETLISVILLILFPIQGISQNEQNEPTLKGKNVIYVYGGWKGHKPTESVDLMVPKLRAEIKELKEGK